MARIDDALLQRKADELKTQLDLALTLYQKQKNLWGQGIGTEVQFLNAKNRKESLDRSLSTLEEQIDQTRIKSPIAGTIDDVMIKVGQMANPSIPIFRVVDLSDLKITASLSDIYINNLSVGSPVIIKFPGLEGQYSEKIAAVGKAIDPLNRTFQINIRPQNSPTEHLKPNMLVSLEINDAIVNKAIIIPQKVVQSSEDESYVYLAVSDGDVWVAEKRIVTTGLQYNGQVVITNGINQGDAILIEGYSRVTDGASIKVNM